jgi:hypothetical protein
MVMCIESVILQDICMFAWEVPKDQLIHISRWSYFLPISSCNLKLYIIGLSLSEEHL